MINNIKPIFNLDSFKSLKNNVLNNQLFHAILLYCEDDVTLQLYSKALISMILCETNEPCLKCENCIKNEKETHPDVEVYGSSGKFVVSDAGMIVEKSNLKPMLSKNKIVLINSFQNSTVQAQNKLLKILEEPPASILFIICTSNLEKVLPTIKSRCKTINIEKLDNYILIDLLKEYNPNFEETPMLLEAGGGYIGKTLSLISNNDFKNSYEFCIRILTEMKSSKDVINYTTIFAKDKNNFLLKLAILQTFLGDILLILNQKENIILNKSNLEILKSIANEFNNNGIRLLIREIDNANKMVSSNVNLNLIIDNLLMKILEVKFLCR